MIEEARSAVARWEEFATRAGVSAESREEIGAMVSALSRECRS